MKPAPNADVSISRCSSRTNLLLLGLDAGCVAGCVIGCCVLPGAWRPLSGCPALLLLLLVVLDWLGPYTDAS